MSIEDVIRETVTQAVAEAIAKVYVPQRRHRLVSTKEAAEYLACSIDEIRNLVASGRLPVTRLSEDSSKWRFDKADLDTLIDSGKDKGNAERGKATNAR